MSVPRFYVGLHHPGRAAHFDRACLSINTLRGRSKPIACPDVLVDSAAFTELAQHGRYRHGVEAYAAELRRLHEAGVVQISAAVAQDYMCEPFMLAKTGLSIADHQRLTIERYDALLAYGLPFPIMPVLQGYDPAEYVAHLRAYGGRLAPGAWVGVGSVCKRNARPEAILAVLHAIKSERPDLRLHGFGIKQTSLLHPGVRALLWSADSMAWSFAARKKGRDANDWREAVAYVDKVTGVHPSSSELRAVVPQAQAIEAMLRNDSTVSDRAVARAIGCSPTTVGKVRQATRISHGVRHVRRGGQAYEMRCV